MKRLSAAVVVLSLICAGSADNANVNAADDNFCPPGAKFCPAPGLSGGGDQSFGLGNPVASRGSRTVSRSHFENQLNDGEQLIMVAPNQQNGMIITPNPAAYADSGYSGSDFSTSYSDPGYSSPVYDNSFSSSSGYGDVYSADTYSSSGAFSTDAYSSSDTYSDTVSSYDSGSTYSLDSGYSSGPVESYSGGFADASSYPADSFSSSGGFASGSMSPVYADEYSSGGVSDASSPFGGGYMPPPPGGASGFSPAPATASSPAAFSPMEDEPVMAMQPSSGRNYRPKNRDPQPMTEAPAPKSFQREYNNNNSAPARQDLSGDYGYDEPAPRQVAARPKSNTIPSREDVSKVRTSKKSRSDDAMSEVANQSYRRSPASAPSTGRNYSPTPYSPAKAQPRVSSAPTEDERIPWWKGGMWRNKNPEKEAAKAEAKARKAKAKADRQNAKNR